MATYTREGGSRKESRLDIRATQEVKERIKQAAIIRGQKVSEFALSVLQPAAEEVLNTEQATRLSDRDRAAFFEMLDASAEPNETLRQAAARYKISRG